MSTIVARAAVFNSQNNHDKFYEVIVSSENTSTALYTVTRRWGRRGSYSSPSGGNIKIEERVFSNLRVAIEIGNNILLSKVNEGYTFNFDGVTRVTNWYQDVGRYVLSTNGPALLRVPTTGVRSNSQNPGGRVEGTPRTSEEVPRLAEKRKEERKEALIEEALSDPRFSEKPRRIEIDPGEEGPGTTCRRIEV